MASSNSDDSEMISGINVTPLVDITLVLLIIFMVTATYIVKASIEVDLPRAAHGGESTGEMLTVVLKPPDTTAANARGVPCSVIAVNGSYTDEAGLLRGFRESLAKDADARALISADARCTHGEVVRLIDLAKGAGIAKFAINIEKDASATSGL